MLELEKAFNSNINNVSNELNKKETVILFSKSKFITILKLDKTINKFNKIDNKINIKIIPVKKFDNHNIVFDLQEAKKYFDFKENVFKIFDFGFYEPNDGLFIDEFVKIEL